MDAANEKFHQNNHKSSHHSSHHPNNHHSHVKSLQKDPELEAEIVYAKENGFEPPRVLPSDTVKKIAETFQDHCIVDKTLFKNLKNGRAEKKARSRGVSGCSIKKDGNRFEYGLDCIDLAYDENSKYSSDKSSSDTDEEFDEYADYVCKYSDEEIRQIVGDYLENGNMEETLDTLEKFIITGDTVHRMVKDMILVTLENAASSFHLAVNLLDEMVLKKWVPLHLIISVLEELVGSVEELSKDMPKVTESLAIFMAKLVQQDVITLQIISLLAVKHADQTDEVKQCIEDAVTFANNRHLLNGKCAPCGGQQPVDVLSAQCQLILKEYLLSNDKQAAECRLTDLKVPHFNHDFVYQACLLALEQMHDQVMCKLAHLLKDMLDKGTVSESCIIKGFNRLYQNLADLYLDLPAAYVLAQRWVDKSLKVGFISKKLAANCPTGTLRTRSRTISEGPDGKLVVEEDGEVNGGESVLMNGHSVENGYSDVGSSRSFSSD